MSLVATSLDIMANTAHAVANIARASLSKVPVLGHLFEDSPMGGLQNSIRNPDLVALSKAPANNTPTSFIYG